jgi:hypothetical protein
MGDTNDKPVMPPKPELSPEQIVKDKMSLLDRTAWMKYHFNFLKYTLEHYQPPSNKSWIGTFEQNIQVCTILGDFCIITNIWTPSIPDLDVFHTFIQKS